MKKKKKNAGSFLCVSEIENGVTVNKLQVPRDAFKQFHWLKTDLKGVDTKDIFVLDPDVSDIFKDKLLRK